MQAWCTTDQVAALLAAPLPGATPLPPTLLQEYVDQATETLYVMSGRKFAGKGTIAALHQASIRGYIALANWQPVRTVDSVTINNVSVPFTLSPGGAFVVVDLQYQLQFATLVLEVGQAVPTSGAKAAAALAAEMVRGDVRYASTGATDVRPVSRLTSVSRQGVTFNYADQGALIANNQTGVYDVDLFLRAVNPTGARYQPKVVTA